MSRATARPATPPAPPTPPTPSDRLRPAGRRAWSEHLWSLAQEATAAILLQTAEGKELTVVPSQFALSVLRAALPEKEWAPIAPAVRPIGRPRKEIAAPNGIGTGAGTATEEDVDLKAEAWKLLKGIVVEEGDPDPNPQPKEET